MNLSRLLQNGIGDITRTVGQFYLKNARGRAFLNRMLPQIKRGAAIREQHEAIGEHIPPFLIASIASQCNLRCAGCYARAGGACAEAPASEDLPASEWRRIFDEAASLGVSFVLLAGGEPLLRSDVISEAAGCSDIVFPIFTNGTLLDATYLALFDQNRHLVPVISIEGDADDTDERRGDGVSSAIHAAMDRLKGKGILFGASITVTRENMKRVYDEDFVRALQAHGCGILFYVEYVPVDRDTEALALRPDDMAWAKEETQGLKRRFGDLVILSFPGDEAEMGGCLASGRGFFHINASGGAEPCPFSPHSKHSLTEHTMLEVLSSRYFAELQGIAAAAGPHVGGCVLFEQEARVRALLSV